MHHQINTNTKYQNIPQNLKATSIYATIRHKTPNELPPSNAPLVVHCMDRALTVTLPIKPVADTFLRLDKHFPPRTRCR